MKKLSRAWAAPLVAAALLAGAASAYAGVTTEQARARPLSAHAASVKPTIVLVHGAFADSSSWSAEIPALQRAGYPVVAVANPLRGVASDTAYLESVLKTISGPVVLVGHSYAGALISQAGAANPNVKALVYVAAYIPLKGESPADLTYKDPGSKLTGDNLVARNEPDGTDLYINPATFGDVYAGGLSRRDVATAAVVQRPIQASALSEGAAVSPPANTPKWEIVALDDHAIPTKTQFFMADRVHAHIVTTHSGHDVPAARPFVVTATILKAARTVR
ncbi:alpha/beta fold hydrolase [Streptomyces sp. NPDC048297]|uniref:alpha/beta hydrolase n=1 Tax=Streptomyces sp. NPDC048297 TaxID=3365531 RepID=UPI00371EA915